MEKSRLDRRWLKKIDPVLYVICEANVASGRVAVTFNTVLNAYFTSFNPKDPFRIPEVLHSFDGDSAIEAFAKFVQIETI